MARPTYKQEQYAQSLVERLREEQAFEVESFARRVASCEDIGKMSDLIDGMKKVLAELEEASRYAERPLPRANLNRARRRRRSGGY